MQRDKIAWLSSEISTFSNPIALGFYILYLYVINELSENSSQDVLNHHNETTNHYLTTIKNLEKINHTIHYVVNTLEDTKDTLETKMNWILSLLGATGKIYSHSNQTMCYVGYDGYMHGTE